MYRRSSVNRCLVLNWPGNGAVRNEIYTKFLEPKSLNLHDSRDGFPVSAPVAT